MACLTNFPLLFSVIIIGFTLDISSASADNQLPPQSYQIPFDINQRNIPPENQLPIITSQDQINDFMWQSFVALNWPWQTDGSRGQPDDEGYLAPWNTGQESQGPVVWETYRKPTEVFIKPKLWPITWDEEFQQPSCPGAGNFPDMRIIGSSTNYSDNSDGLNQPYIQANYPTGPAVDQNGNFLRYEVGLNQSYFSYISYFRYYDPRTQIRSVRRYIRFVENNNGKAPPPSNNRNARFFQQLPNGTEAYLTKKFNLPDYALQGIVEWKATWKLLDGDDNPDRFYWRYVTFLNPDGSCTGPVRAGLIAFHIHRFTQFGHIGTTFEQVDNTRLQSEYSSEQIPDAAELPLHASLNPGGTVSPIYDGGYEVCDAEGNNCQSGLGGLIPTPIKKGEALSANPNITNITRQVEIPENVQAINAKWRERLKETVWFYYQMIGTQNRNLNFESTPNIGPGLVGAQASNTRNLINTALESYTQEGWSCAQCHQNAFPLGVSLPFPPFEQAFAPLHTISFLLQNAQSN